jgi:predicted acetyltransferase
VSSATARLVRPEVSFRDSYIEAVREHQPPGRFVDSRYVGGDPARLARDFAGFVHDLLDRERPASILGRVPEAFYWLIDGDEYVGQASFRDFPPDDPGLREVGHIGYDVRPSRQGQGYGIAILGAMLDEMRARGVSHVYVNCDEDNAPSRRVIEHWNGVFEGSIAIPGRSARRRRYRIEVA